jgi:hypothetical protein
MLSIRKDYLTLAETAEDCDIPMEHLRYFGEEGLLSICLRRIPVRVALEGIIYKSECLQSPRQREILLHALDAPQPLNPADIYRIFANCGEKTEITSIKTPLIMNLVKAITPGIMAGIDDLVIMREEEKHFASAYLNKPEECDPLIIVSPDFKNFILYGHEYFFGEKQARIIKYLHEQYALGNPWVHSKKLMDIADSHSDKLHNLFNHNSDWRRVIRGGRNGYYMLNLPITKNPPMRNMEENQLSLF